MDRMDRALGPSHLMINGSYGQGSNPALALHMPITTTDVQPSSRDGKGTEEQLKEQLRACPAGPLSKSQSRMVHFNKCNPYTGAACPLTPINTSSTHWVGPLRFERRLCTEPATVDPVMVDSVISEASLLSPLTRPRVCQTDVRCVTGGCQMGVGWGDIL